MKGGDEVGFNLPHLPKKPPPVSTPFQSSGVNGSPQFNQASGSSAGATSNPFPGSSVSNPFGSGSNASPYVPFPMGETGAASPFAAGANPGFGAGNSQVALSVAGQAPHESTKFKKTPMRTASRVVLALAVVMILVLLYLGFIYLGGSIRGYNVMRGPASAFALARTTFIGVVLLLVVGLTGLVLSIVAIIRRDSRRYGVITLIGGLVCSAATVVSLVDAGTTSVHRNSEAIVASLYDNLPSGDIGPEALPQILENLKKTSKATAIPPSELIEAMPPEAKKKLPPEAWEALEAQLPNLESLLKQ